jgi:tellurite resistance protein TerC
LPRFASRRNFSIACLFWGILGALAMRGAMIGVGAALVQHFGWVLYLFGVFLRFYRSQNAVFRHEAIDPEKNPAAPRAQNISRRERF